MREAGTKDRRTPCSAHSKGASMPPNTQRQTCFGLRRPLCLSTVRGLVRGFVNPDNDVPLHLLSLSLLPSLYDRRGTVTARANSLPCTATPSSKYSRPPSALHALPNLGDKACAFPPKVRVLEVLGCSTVEPGPRDSYLEAGRITQLISATLSNNNMGKHVQMIIDAGEWHLLINGLPSDRNIIGDLHIKCHFVL